MVPFGPRPLLQTPLAQSAAVPQDVAFAQPVGQPPPQSTARSAPFFTRSVQLEVVQSAPVAQVSPLPQGGQEPPQSTSVSVPFRAVSLQPAAAQRLFAGEQ